MPGAAPASALTASGAARKREREENSTDGDAEMADEDESTWLLTSLGMTQQRARAAVSEI